MGLRSLQTGDSKQALRRGKQQCLPVIVGSRAPSESVWGWAPTGGRGAEEQASDCTGWGGEQEGVLLALHRRELWRKAVMSRHGPSLQSNECL